MWYSIAEFNSNSIHNITCSGVFVNDLYLFYEKTSIYTKKEYDKADRFYININDRSENYAVL